jgi:hypothetical protein
VRVEDAGMRVQGACVRVEDAGADSVLTGRKVQGRYEKLEKNFASF